MSATGAVFQTTETVDFVIVGSGAAGGVMARELSVAGFTVVVLEQGPRLEAADFRHDEFDYWYNNALTNNPVANPQSFRRDAIGNVNGVNRNSSRLRFDL